MTDINRLIDNTELSKEEIFKIIKEYPSTRISKLYPKDLNFFKVFFHMMGANVKALPMPNLRNECDDNKEDYFEHCELKFITLLKQCYIKRYFPEVLFSQLDEMELRHDLFNPVLRKERYDSCYNGKFSNILFELNQIPSRTLYKLHLNQLLFAKTNLLEFEMFLFYSMRNKFIPQIDTVLNDMLPLLYQDQKSDLLLLKYEDYLYSLKPWLAQNHTKYLVDKEEAQIIYDYLFKQKDLFL